MNKSIIGLFPFALVAFGLGCNPSPKQTVVPQKDTIMISRMAFQPAVLYVNRWDTVVWINKDLVIHDVTGYPKKQWYSDSIASGQSWKREVGTDLDYFCSIHPTMKGKIKIRTHQ